jgi:hypothetical protein
VEHRFRLLSYEVAFRDPAALLAGRLSLLASEADQAAIPVLHRTSYELRPVDAGVEILEEGAPLATVVDADEAILELDARLRLRVIDVAARSGWLPLLAGIAMLPGGAWLLLGATADDRAALLAELIADGAEAGTAELALVRSGGVIGYPRPVWLPPGTAGPRAVDPARSGGRPVLRPAPVVGIVLLDGATPAAADRTALLTRSLLAARLDTSVRRPADDVAEVAAVVRSARAVLGAGSQPGERSSVLRRIAAGAPG